MRCDRKTIVVGCVMMILVSALSAQRPDTLRSTSTDPYDPYLRYIRPGACTQAIVRLDAQYWRDRRPDTVAYAPQTDTLPASVLHAGRACAAHFSVATTPVRDLLSLTQLYLWTGQDTLADAAVERLLAVDATYPILDRGWTVFQLVSSALAVRPVRESVVRQYLATLTALDVAASPWKLMAHTAVARYEMSIGNTEMALLESSAAVTAGAAMEKHDQIDRMPFVLEGYSLLAEARAMHAGGSAALAVFDTALQKLLPVVESDPSEVMWVKSSIESWRRRFALLGQNASPLKAEHWFPLRIDTTTQPAHGKVSLVVLVNANCGSRCFGTYAAIRRLHNKFQTAGLHIILMSSTAGYFHEQPTNTAVEVEKIQHYFMSFLKVPGTLAIHETSSVQQPDGRRVDLTWESGRDYFSAGNAVLVGKDGKIRAITTLTPESEATLAGRIAKAFASP